MLVSLLACIRIFNAHMYAQVSYFLWTRCNGVCEYIESSSAFAWSEEFLQLDESFKGLLAGREMGLLVGSWV